MSKRWGGDYEVTEHRDLQASTMAVNSPGTHVLLAGRRCFAVKNLDSDTDPIKKFQRQSKYEVGTAEWNPSLNNSNLCAVSNNTHVEILNFSGETGYNLQSTHNLRAHTRVVSDLNWHPKEPDILATCSIDTYIHIWDIRDQRKPSLSFSAVAGASQVRWNELSTNLIATAHDGDVKVWDQRKGNSPIQYIAAHLTKIYGLDWCPFAQNFLATSSQDCTVKFFDTNNPRRAESILTTTSPVWRARYTPFGEGLVTIVVPQLRRGENSLLLWSTSNLANPIYSFVGHSDVVLEFAWRQKKSDKFDYELVTWSKDQCLRKFKIPALLKKFCGHDEIDDENDVFSQYSQDDDLRSIQSVQELSNNQTNDDESNFTSQNVENSKSSSENPLIKVEKDAPPPSQPKTLQQEFSLINMNIPNVEVNLMNVADRSCTVTAANKNYKVVLKVNFPGNYPYSAQPTFQVCPGTNVDNTIMTKLLKVLKQTAQQRVRKNRSCLEPCLRQLIATLEKTCVKEESETDHVGYHIHHTENVLNSNKMHSDYQDAYIPFPRTSGAKFCSVGILVCFGRSSYARRASINPESSTPRALSALSSNMSNSGHYMQRTLYPNNTYVQSNENISIGSYYFQDRVARRGPNNSNRSYGKSNNKNIPSIVRVYDASSLFFVNKELAEKYIINPTDIPAMCRHNANVAATLDKRDLVQAWCLADLVVSQPFSNIKNLQLSYQIPETDSPWTLHPFGQNLIHSLIQHYANQSDIQMAGMLSCAFSQRSESPDPHYNRIVISKSVNVSKHNSGKWWKPGGSPYHTIHPADTNIEGWNFPNLKQNRSNSWSESLDDLQIVEDISNEQVQIMKPIEKKNATLYDAYKRAYAEVLHGWRLLDARAQVLKHVSNSSNEAQKIIEFQSECLACNKSSKGLQCTHCKRLSFQCTVCHISVRGPSIFCFVCGHGGHTQHLAHWFSSETVCPTGCGCCCLQENTSLLKM